MELILNPSKSDIDFRYVNFPTHDFAYFDCLAVNGWKPVYCKFRDGSGILALEKGKHFRILGDSMGIENMALIYKFSSYLFSRELATKIEIMSKETPGWLDLELHQNVYKLTQSNDHVYLAEFLLDGNLHLQPECHPSLLEMKKLVLELHVRGYEHEFKLIESNEAKKRVICKDETPVSIVFYFTKDGKGYIPEIISKNNEESLKDSLAFLKKLGMGHALVLCNSELRNLADKMKAKITRYDLISFLPNSFSS